PTTFLDVAHQVEVLDLLAELNREEGRTIVMVLHDINQACRYAHHLIVMKEGRLIAQGDPGEVMSVELIRDVFGLACRVMSDPGTGGPLCVPLPGHARRPRASRGVTDEESWLDEPVSAPSA
ncbi:MAG: ABC transporter ATP-binding protein, partial [Gemmatimonadota bacterium]